MAELDFKFKISQVICPKLHLNMIEEHRHQTEQRMDLLSKLTPLDSLKLSHHHKIVRVLKFELL